MKSFNTDSCLPEMGFPELLDELVAELGQSWVLAVDSNKAYDPVMVGLNGRIAFALSKIKYQARDGAWMTFRGEGQTIKTGANITDVGTLFYENNNPNIASEDFRVTGLIEIAFPSGHVALDLAHRCIVKEPASENASMFMIEHSSKKEIAN